ncbi:MAG: hypothetical protein PHR60_06365 [Eubacteriales bacterium]|nr:hypothetical protein [Eubacteriales bacterium]
MLAGAWGVKENVDLNQVENLKEYLKTITGIKLELESGENVKILKADVKERKGEAFLLFRYQLVI